MMRVGFRAAFLAPLAVLGVALSTIVPAEAAPSTDVLAGAHSPRVTCRAVVVRQYRIRLRFPNPYARRGQNPYDGGILTVLSPQISGARQRGTVATWYVVSNQRWYRTESNSRGGYVSFRMGISQWARAGVTSGTDSRRTPHVTCRPVAIPPVRNLRALRVVPERAFPNV
jgi:hypothetical protein